MEIQLLEEWTACEPIALYVQNKTTFKKFVLFRAGFVVNKTLNVRLVVVCL